MATARSTVSSGMRFLLDWKRPSPRLLCGTYLIAKDPRGVFFARHRNWTAKREWYRDRYVCWFPSSECWRLLLSFGSIYVGSPNRSLYIGFPFIVPSPLFLSGFWAYKSQKKKQLKTKCPQMVCNNYKSHERVLNSLEHLRKCSEHSVLNCRDAIMWSWKALMI